MWWRWEGVLVAFPIVSYGFTAHQYLFHLYPASQRPSMRKMTSAVQRGMLLSAAIYLAVGACGYSAFGYRCAAAGGGGLAGDATAPEALSTSNHLPDPRSPQRCSSLSFLYALGEYPCRTAGDVLRNFGGVGASGWRLQAERVLKYAFGLSLLGTIPLTVVPLHATFAPWLAACSPAVEAAAKQAEAAGTGGAGIPLSHLQESLLTAGILGE